MEPSQTHEDLLTAKDADKHRGVMQGVVGLEEVLSRPVVPAMEWLDALGGRLETLTDLLSTHFRDERQGRLFGELPERFPQHAARLKELAIEHDDILRRVAALQEATGRYGATSEIYQLRELNARGQLLAATIRRHEAEENEIILRAYWDEVGAGD